MIAANKILGRKSLSEEVRWRLRDSSGLIKQIAFADEDPMLLRRLANVSGFSAVIPVTQTDWHGEASALAEAIAEAAEEFSVASFFLVGSSSTWTRKASAQPLLQESEFKRGRCGIVDRMFDAVKTRKRAEQAFAKQIRTVIEVPQVRDGLKDGTLDLQALYFRAESGVLAVFDPRRDNFCAMLK